jgi:hypothetical protein
MNGLLTRGGKRYFMTLIADATRYGYIYLLKTKDEAFPYYKIFKAKLENQLERKIKRLRDDRGGEYISNEFSQFYADVAKMTSHAIFQYNILAIDDTHNTWPNMIVKMTILRLLGSSDDKEKIGVARPEGPPQRTKN